MSRKEAMVSTANDVVHGTVEDKVELILNNAKHTILAYASLARETAVAANVDTEIMKAGPESGE